MADMIQCPVCGAENPLSQKICQQTPLTSDASFKPGQSPVHKDTGELEGLLPQWLKDARQSAKTEESGEQQPQQPKQDSAQPAASGVDLLAGLQSQAGDEDDEEVPDWLASITGTTSSKQKTDETETSGTRWVETGNTMQRYGIVLADAGNIALTFETDRHTENDWASLGITPQIFWNGSAGNRTPLQVTDFAVIDTGARIAESYECDRTVLPASPLFANGFE